MSQQRGLDEQGFESAAATMLQKLERELTDVEGLEADLQSGILTLEFEDGAKYIVNSHRAARQIWMAAEHNAWHFDFDAATARWSAVKSGDELVETIAAVVSRKLGRPFTIAG